MSNLENFKNINEELAVYIPGLGAFFSNDAENADSYIPIEELLEVSVITQIPVDEILKPIDFPYWSL